MRSPAISAAAPAIGRSSMPRCRPAREPADDALSRRTRDTDRAGLAGACRRTAMSSSATRRASSRRRRARRRSRALYAAAPRRHARRRLHRCRACGSPRACASSTRSSGSAAWPASTCIEDDRRGARHRRDGDPCRRPIRRSRAIDPDLGELMRRFGSAQVRASGTVGGNIANGSPIGDLAPALIALGAELELRQGDATRTMPLENFFIAYRKQDRLPGEFVRRVVVPKLEGRTRSSAPTRSRSASTRTSRPPWAPSSSPSTDGASPPPASPSAAWRRRRSAPPRRSGADRRLPRRARVLGRGASRRLRAITSPSTITAPRPPTAPTVARNLVFKALSETASGETRATRIVGQREALEAAE